MVNHRPAPRLSAAMGPLASARIDVGRVRIMVEWRGGCGKASLFDSIPLSEVMAYAEQLDVLRNQ